MAEAILGSIRGHVEGLTLLKGRRCDSQTTPSPVASAVPASSQTPLLPFHLRLYTGCVSLSAYSLAILG